jgi:PilZ domain
VEHLPVETTLYSLSDDCPAEPERRLSGDRHLTLFRVGTLLVDGRRELCLIKNISAGGMMLRAYCPLVPGRSVAIELKTGQPIEGCVSWAKDGQVGIAFARPIDVLSILAQNDSGPRPRMPRIETAAWATFREGANSYRLRATDISQGGIKLESNVLLSVGAAVVVSLVGLAPQPGVIRWTEDGAVGVSFNRLIPLAELVGWLQQQRGAARAA